jgi:hypothetical protein
MSEAAYFPSTALRAGNSGGCGGALNWASAWIRTVTSINSLGATLEATAEENGVKKDDKSL